MRKTAIPALMVDVPGLDKLNGKARIHSVTLERIFRPDDNPELHFVHQIDTQGNQKFLGDTYRSKYSDDLCRSVVVVVLRVSPENNGEDYYVSIAVSDGGDGEPVKVHMPE